MLKSSNIVYKILAIGIIILFIGVGIQPVFAVNPNSTDSEDDCSLCPKVSNQYIVRLKSLLPRLEKYDNILSKLSKNYPEIAEKYQELSERITIFKEINMELIQWDFPILKKLILCPISYIIFTIVFAILLVPMAICIFSDYCNEDIFFEEVIGPIIVPIANIVRALCGIPYPSP